MKKRFLVPTLMALIVAGVIVFDKITQESEVYTETVKKEKKYTETVEEADSIVVKAYEEIDVITAENERIKSKSDSLQILIDSGEYDKDKVEVLKNEIKKLKRREAQNNARIAEAREAEVVTGSSREINTLDNDSLVKLTLYQEEIINRQIKRYEKLDRSYDSLKTKWEDHIQTDHTDLVLDTLREEITVYDTVQVVKADTILITDDKAIKKIKKKYVK